MNRRDFLALSAAISAAGLACSVAATSQSPFKALAFDAFAIFDPRPIFAGAERMFGDPAKAMNQTWRTKLFEYQWLRALSNHYADFMQVTEEALVFAARASGIALSSEQRSQLLQGFMELQPWVDVASGLDALRSSGLRLVFLSNATPAMLEAGVRATKLQDRFERLISTDRIHTFKPDARAYRLGMEELHLAKHEILFVAFAGWDAAGAKSFGYPTFWLNRLQSPAEELGATADATGTTMAELVAFVKSR